MSTLALEPVNAGDDYNNSKDKPLASFILHFCWNHRKELCCLGCCMLLFAFAITFSQLFWMFNGTSRKHFRNGGSSSAADLDFSLVQQQHMNQQQQQQYNEQQQQQQYNEQQQQHMKQQQYNEQQQHKNQQQQYNKQQQQHMNQQQQQHNEQQQQEEPLTNFQPVHESQQEEPIATSVSESLPPAPDSGETMRLRVVPPNVASSNGDDDPVRREAVRGAFQHAWRGYKSHAWGKDELKPVSKTYKNWVGNGIGLTILDSMSTMIIMDLKDEFMDSLEWVKRHLSFDVNQQISLFETTIRALGGLLSAYELTNNKEEILLRMAVDLGNRLLPAFSSPTGIPYGQINLHNPQDKSTPSWMHGSAVLSEFTTLQLEFRKLSLLSGDKRYDDAVTRVMEVLQRDTVRPNDGLYPASFNIMQGHFSNEHLTFGAYGDSCYEYLLKQYLLTNKTEQTYRKMYLQSMKGMFDRLWKQSSPNHLSYIAEYKNIGGIDHKMDHLVCFAGAMLALGYASNTTNDIRHLHAGAALTETCYEMYARSVTGLSPETALFNMGNDFSTGVPYYILRPETVESIFYMYRITRDPKYREWGWKIFQSLEQHTKIATGGYSGIHNVQQVPVMHDDHMQSFFLAETLKYLYLLFSPHHVIRLDQWVFNTEAHPLRIV